jgi:hypothetical protein
MNQPMTEYQLRDLKKYEESAKRLRLIVDQINKLDLGDVTEFEMMPRLDDEFDRQHTPRMIFIEALIMEGKLEIMCERDGYGNTDRWEFTAIGWPKYTDENGQSCTIDPSNLWNPKVNRPQTTAAQDREPRLIASQISNKILGEYIDIFKRCLDSAQSHQAHCDKTKDARSRLADACQDEREFRGRPQSDFYVKNITGDPIHVKFQSEGDVKVNLTTDEAIDVIALLRKRRAK